MDHSVLKGLISKWRDDATKCRNMAKRYREREDKIELQTEANTLDGCAKTLETLLNESTTEA